MYTYSPYLVTGTIDFRWQGYLYRPRFFQHLRVEKNQQEIFQRPIYKSTLTTRRSPSSLRRTSDCVNFAHRKYTIIVIYYRISTKHR